MAFAEPVIGPAASGRTRWLNPSYELHSKKTELPRRSEMTLRARSDILHCGKAVRLFVLGAPVSRSLLIET